MVIVAKSEMAPPGDFLRHISYINCSMSYVSSYSAIRSAGFDPLVSFSQFPNSKVLINLLSSSHNTTLKRTKELFMGSFHSMLLSSSITVRFVRRKGVELEQKVGILILRQLPKEHEVE